jgi:hypothetical protein
LLLKNNDMAGQMPSCSRESFAGKPPVISEFHPSACGSPRAASMRSSAEIRSFVTETVSASSRAEGRGAIERRLSNSRAKARRSTARHVTAQDKTAREPALCFTPIIETVRHLVRRLTVLSANSSILTCSLSLTVLS